MDLRDVIKSRADIKRFDLKKPDWRRVVRSIDAATYAPTAGSHFSTRFILVTDGKVIGKLAEASQQAFVGKAKMCVVVVSDDKGLKRSYGKRGEMYSRQHAGAAIENFLLWLEKEGLVTSWVWYFDDEQVRRALGASDSIQVEGIFPIGKETKMSRRKRRIPKLDNILFFEKYGNKKMLPDVIVGQDAI